MLRSDCISRMSTVPTNLTNARAEEAIYTNRGTNAHTSRPFTLKPTKGAATNAAPLPLYSS
jgi:hypothetical protein